MRQVEWIESGFLGATAQNPAVYEDCNLAAPGPGGKKIILKLQAYLQQQVPNSNVKQTGFLDQQTCAAWKVSPAARNLERMGISYPTNFNVTNILDTLDGRTGNTHHWKCNGPSITPDCTKVPMRTDCGSGQVFSGGKCVDVQPTAGRGKKKSKAGLVLLAGAAVAGLAYAMS